MKQFAPLWLALVFLAGCAGMAQPKNTLESLLAASEYANALTLAVNDARTTRTLSEDQHEKALDMLQDSHDTVELGLQAYRAGETGQAMDMLARVELGLRAVALILAETDE